MECKHIVTHEIEKSPYIGLYCADCGKWLKWMPQNRDPSDFVMPYGKFKGRKFCEMPEWYIKWLSENADGKIADKVIEWHDKFNL